MTLPLAAAVAFGIAALAWSARALTAGGALAATLVGAAILSALGWGGALVLGAFFIPSTLVGRLGGATGERRTAGQVFANGGAAALGAVLALDAPTRALAIVTCSLAAAAADTWATSVGARSPTPPRHLLNGKPVPAGTDGAVSLAGTLGGFAGGLIVALAGLAAGGGISLLLGATAIGFGGMLLDSLLGATLQGRLLTNDGVNAIATLSAALAALAL